MKKLLLGWVAGAALLAGSAMAADLAAVPVVVEPVFTWSGFYAGLSAGGRWSDVMWQTLSVTPAPGLPPDPTTTLPTSAYFVQVAAVSKQEDADALVDALKKKQYPALVAAPVATDKLFRVQVGPFTDIKDAEAMRTKLIGDGYSPILKK